MKQVYFNNKTNIIEISDKIIDIDNIFLSMLINCYEV